MLTLALSCFALLKAMLLLRSNSAMSWTLDTPTTPIDTLMTTLSDSIENGEAKV